MTSLLALLLTLISPALSHILTSKHLIDLTHDSYLQHVVNNQTNTLRNGPWFIVFYAPWCGHCKKLMPAWNQFAEQEGHKNQLKVAVVDCDNQENNDLCGAFDITGYPRILYLRGDQYYRYRGERTVEKITEFVYQGEYLEAEHKDIPFYIQKTERSQKASILENIQKLANTIMIKLGLLRIPKELQYILFGVLISIPFHFIQKKVFKVFENGKKQAQQKKKEKEESLKKDKKD